MKQIMVLLVLLVLVSSIATPAHAQGPITVSANNFTNTFPTQLVFQLEAQSSAKITDVALITQIDNVPSSSRQLPQFTSDNQVKVRYDWSLRNNYVPPGVTGQYWWTIRDSAGNNLDTQKQPFRVEDSAHPWNKLSNDQLVLNWYLGGDSFGKALFDNGIASMKQLQQDTGVTVDRQIQIWIYGSRTDFFRALEPGASEWTGGRAFPDYAIIMIDVEPTQLDWGKGATAHELTHQVIHQKISSPLGGLSMPHWVDEGLAVYYEGTPGQVDPQFSGPLNTAIRNDTLTPIRSISGSFPADSRAAELAYGESWSVVNFIFRHYGKEKMTQLLQGFKTGGFYDDIFRQVLGVDTDGLEAEWRKDVGAKPRAVPTRDASQPTAFPTFGLSSDGSTAPQSATATPGAVAAQATKAPQPTGAAQAPANPLTTFCGGAFGLIALVLFGATRIGRRAAR
jgi:peptidase MA superfamily protein